MSRAARSAGPDIVELQKASPVIEGAAGMRPMLGGIFSLREGSEPMEIAVVQTSPNLFELLGVSPRWAVALRRKRRVGAAEQVIVLTHHLWSRLGANPGILGTEVRLQGRPHTVIGVLPRDFTFVRNDASAPPQRVDAYIPFAENHRGRRIHKPVHTADSFALAAAQRRAWWPPRLTLPAA